EIAELTPGLLHQVFLIVLYYLCAGACRSPQPRIGIELVYPARFVLHVQTVGERVPLAIERRTDDRIRMTTFGLLLLKIELEVDGPLEIVEKSSGGVVERIFKVSAGRRPLRRC